jgi:hypothetical protein
MTKNPFFNAVLALGYIVGIISILFYGGKLLGGKQESILYPIGGLSLFVLSASIMGYIFFYHPVLMLISGDREKAVQLFLKTIGVFACLTALVFITILIVNG